MVFVGITGPSHCGKQGLASLLAEKYGYIQLRIIPKDAELLDRGIAQNLETLLDVEATLKLMSLKTEMMQREHIFPNGLQLMSYVLSNYTKNFVSVIPAADFEALFPLWVERPCFLGLAIDCPMSIRYATFQKRSKAHHKPMDNSLEAFMAAEGGKSYALLYQECHVTFLNDRYLADAEQLTTLFDSKLKQLIDFFPFIIRPSWDAYFLKLSRLAATRSNCMKRKIGCVLVSAKTHRIIATGYNGTPIGLPNCNQGGCLRCNSNCGTGMDLAACLCIHAEENALLEAGRERICRTKDAGDPTILYCTTCPCLGCTKKIIQCGIVEVVYADNYHMDGQTLKLFGQAGISCRQISSKFLLEPKIYL